MKNQHFELALVLALVAGFALWFQRGRAGEQPQMLDSPSPFAIVPLAQGPAVAESPLSGEASVLWRSQYEAAQEALGQGDNKKAESYLLDALRQAPQAGEEALHETLDDLGLVCYRQGEYLRSADFQARAIEAAQNLKRPDRGATVGLYESRYALALASMDKTEQALAALERARIAYKQGYPSGGTAYTEALNDLAAQHRTLGDNKGAARLLGE